MSADVIVEGEINPILVSNIEDCKKIIQEIFDEAEADKDNSAVGLDCEGVALGVHGKLTLVQLSSWQGNIYLFDVLKKKELLSEDSLLTELLKSDKITKVLHAPHNDNLALYFQHGINLNRVYDTQLAHSLICLEKGEEVRQTSYQDMCKSQNLELSQESLEKNNIYKKYPKIWEERPLKRKMKVIAADDVKHSLSIMKKQLAEKKDGESVIDAKLFELACQNEIFYAINQQTIRQNSEIVKLRKANEKEFQEKDKIFKTKDKQMKTKRDEYVNLIELNENRTQKLREGNQAPKELSEWQIKIQDLSKAIASKTVKEISINTKDITDEIEKEKTTLKAKHEAMMKKKDEKIKYLDDTISDLNEKVKHLKLISNSTSKET